MRFVKSTLKTIFWDATCLCFQGLLYMGGQSTTAFAYLYWNHIIIHWRTHTNHLNIQLSLVFSISQAPRFGTWIMKCIRTTTEYTLFPASSPHFATNPLRDTYTWYTWLWWAIISYPTYTWTRVMLVKTWKFDRMPAYECDVSEKALVVRMRRGCFHMRDYIAIFIEPNTLDINHSNRRQLIASNFLKILNSHNFGDSSRAKSHQYVTTRNTQHYKCRMHRTNTRWAHAFQHASTCWLERGRT